MRFLFLTLGLVMSACGEPATADSAEASSGASAEETAALSSCTKVAYHEALGHYRAAVDASNERLAKGVCASSTGFLRSIANDASRAVMTCPEFRGVIRTSPWAAPLRTALGATLNLRSLTGELLVAKDSPYANWAGVERFLTDGGLTFWARAQGAYGSRVIVDFRANGAARWKELVFDARTQVISLKESSATFTVTRPGTRSTGPVKVTITHDGKTERFSLGVRDALNYRDASMFVLTPSRLTEDGTPELFSLVSECDA
jgi:hypothetical protein